MSKTPKQRLEENLTRVDDCLEWQGGTTGRGYGQIMINGVKHATHRLAWVLANGVPIPEGMSVLHSCDNKICCEPSHLRIGTQADNMRDYVERGLDRYPPSEDPYSKVNPSPGMARLIADYNRNKTRRLAREKAQKEAHR